MKKFEVVIVGAGISGRIAKRMRPDALLIEAASENKQRSACMVGCNYLHEDLPELDTREVQIITGVNPKGWREHITLPTDLDNITGAAMQEYQHKCRSWNKIADETDADLHMGERKNRYVRFKTGFAFGMPNVEIRWDTVCIDVEPQHSRMSVASSDGEYGIEYGVLIWTAPLNALLKAMRFDPQRFDLQGTPIFYKSMSFVSQTMKSLIAVEYVPDPCTSIYRRTCYVDDDGNCDVSLESIREMEEFEKFWPGKIKAMPGFDHLEKMLNNHGIYPAGRFARWDPDELTHHTAERLRGILK